MGMEDAVYLDHNATTTVRPQAAAAVSRALSMTGNASSVHAFGRRVRAMVEDAREHVAALVGAGPARVVFTSGGTEADNLALGGVGRDRVLVSAVEHPAVLKARADVEIIPVDEDGVVDAGTVAGLLSGDAVPALVSVMLANNETGVIQPVAEIAETAHAAGALVHCDAVQAAGKIAIDMAALGVDLLSLSAHKVGGPAGVGALVVADGVDLEAIQLGGGQERGRRGGTENFSGIAGFGAAAAEAGERLGQFAGLAAWRDRLEESVLAMAPARILGLGAPRLPNTSLLTMPGVDSETQVMAFDLAGIAVSAGAACSSGKVEPSHVVDAMGIDRTEAVCAIRVSLGWNSEEGDVDRFLAAWSEIYRRSGGGAVSAAE